MAEGVFINYTLLTGIVIILGPVGVFVARYYWKKAKCMIAMKNKIEELTRHDVASGETHSDLKEEIDEIKTKQLKNEVYLKLLLDDRGIKYSD